MRMERLFQVTLIASILCLSWLGMMIVHEFGHVVIAWAGGERVYKVVLHPLVISRTDTSHEKHPLLVNGGGPVFGSLIPVCAWVLVRAFRLRFVYARSFDPPDRSFAIPPITKRTDSSWFYRKGLLDTPPYQSPIIIWSSIPCRKNSSMSGSAEWPAP